MKVLFLADNLLLHQEPLGIMTLSTVLKNAGHHTRCVNVEQTEDLRGEVLRYAPDILGYSISTLKAREILTINLQIREYCDALSVFGGPHPTYFPEMIEEEGVDVICRGEGEGALLDLIDALEGRRAMHDIPNLWVKQNGQIHKNDLRMPEQNLDAQPFADRDLVEGLVLGGSNRGGINFAMSGRGCPAACTFCFNQARRDMTQGRIVRRRSVQNVVAEMRLLKEERGSRFISFQDDAFTISKRWLLEFADAYPLEVGLPFCCHGRADQITEETAEALARAGCIFVFIGLESGNDFIRNEILKKHVSKESLLRASVLLRRYGIRMLTFNMVGVPHETIDTVLETIDLNRRCQVGVMQTLFYAPHPRTPLAEYAIERGFFNGDYESLPEDWYQGVTLDLPYKEDLNALYRLMNVCVDFRYFFPIVKIVTRLPRFARRALYPMLERLADWLRRRGRGRDSRWQDWSTYYNARNPYQEQLREARETSGLSRPIPPTSEGNAE